LAFLNLYALRLFLIAITALVNFQFVLKAQTPAFTGNGYYLINESGKKLNETHFDFIGNESSDLFLAAAQGQFGYLNSNGYLVIKPQFDIAFSFYGDFAVASTSNKHYLINKKGQRIDTLDQIQKPQIFRGHLAVASKRNKNVIINSDGETVLRSKNKLLLAEVSGIADWHKNEKKLDLYSTSGSKRNIFKVQDQLEFDSVLVSKGGFLIGIKTDDGIEKATIFNHIGNPVWTGKTDGIDLALVRKVNDSWILIPKKYKSYEKVITENVIEFYYPYEDLIGLHGSDKKDIGLSISHLQERNDFAKIVGINRWIHYTGSDNDLKQVIEQIALGDGSRTLVKYDNKWHFYEKHGDIIDVDYKYVHPMGNHKSMFFASNSSGPSNEKKWAFVNLESNIATAELFQPITNSVGSYEMTHFEPRRPFEWKHELIPAYKGDSLVYLNDYGRVVWAIEKQKPTTLTDFLIHDLSFMARDYKAMDRSMKLKENKLFEKNGFVLRLSKGNNGLEVTITNTKKDVVPIEVQDGSFIIKIERKDDTGHWVPYLNMVSSTCGNSYYMIDFPAKSYTTTKINILEGGSVEVLRAVVYLENNEELISNPVTMNVNLAQGWAKTIPFSLLAEEI
jgi:hypothetical protein